MNPKAAGCTALFIVSSAIPVLGQTSEWDQAWWFREQVGLAPADVAAMGLEAEPHAALAAAVREHFATHAEDDGLLIDRLVEASGRLMGTVSWGRDAREDFDFLRAERRAVIQALRALTDQLRDLLPVELRPYVVRAVANSGIDSPYRLLGLTREQREQIRALQEEQDILLLDARQRTRSARLDAARQRFDNEVRALLTEDQRTELDQLAAGIAARLEAVWEIELADYPVDDPLAAATEPDQDLKATDTPSRPLPAYLLAQTRLIGERFNNLLVGLAQKAKSAPVVR